MVDQVERRRALVDTLGALASIPQFEVRLRAVPDAAPKAAAETPTSTRVFEVMRDESPVSAVLAEALIKQGATAGPAADDMARALAIRVVNASQSALRHTWAFKRLVGQVDGDRLRTVDPDAHRRWQGLLREHVTAFANHSAHVEVELTAIGLLPDAANESGTPDADADQFVRLAEQQDRSVRALFAAAPAGAAVDVHRTLGVLAAQLRTSAILAERLLDSGHSPVAGITGR
jgi:hypothetical protein